MGHHDVYGASYNGISKADLESLAQKIVSEHNYNEGYDHSIYVDYRILQGVSTEDEFFNRVESRDNTDGFAQLIYSPNDLIAKEFNLTLKISDLSELDDYDALSKRVQSECEKKGLSLNSFQRENVDNQISRGLTGNLIKKVNKATGKLTSRFVIYNTRNEVIGYSDTQKEAEEVAFRAVKNNVGHSFNPTAALRVVKETVREDSDNLSTVGAELRNGRLHLKVRAFKIKKNAKAAGWAVALDCHH